jgi:hypothetical protein
MVTVILTRTVMAMRAVDRRGSRRSCVTVVSLDSGLVWRLYQRGIHINRTRQFWRCAVLSVAPKGPSQLSPGQRPGTSDCTNGSEL